MMAGRLRAHLVRAIGAAGVLGLVACTSNEPYGARFNEDGYTYTHRQHGLYNDSQYRYQRYERSRYDDGYRYSYAPPVQYNYYYDDGGYPRYGYRPAYRYYYYNDRDLEPVYDEDGELIYYHYRYRD